MTRRPEEIQAAKIFLRCQSAPTAKELEQFLPSPIIPAWRLTTWNEKVQVEPSGSGSYQVTILAPGMAADYLAWNVALEPEFTLIRQALQRPYTRINGDYQNLWDIPFPNFVAVRAVAQRQGALAQCHLLQGQPEEALRDLTLIHDLCHILESRPSGKPMTLVAAMIHVAVAGLYTGVIADGLAWHDWREPQLVALQEQLKEINLAARCQSRPHGGVCQRCVTRSKPSFPTRMDELSIPPRSTTGWTKLKETVIGELIPRGWVYQNMARIANVHQTIIDSMDPAGQMVFPEESGCRPALAAAAGSHHRPYTFLLSFAIPNLSRAFHRDRPKSNAG